MAEGVWSSISSRWRGGGFNQQITHDESQQSLIRLFPVKESSFISELIHDLANIHQMQHQTLAMLHMEQEQRFQTLLQAHEEDCQVIQCLFQLAGTLAAATSSHYGSKAHHAHQDGSVG